MYASTQRPVTGEAGRTGTWRVLRPVLNESRCVAAVRGKHVCHLCWLYCPEATASRTVPPAFDYDHCKGCGICAEECPHQAIVMVPEHGSEGGGKKGGDTPD
ncbi:MAG: 4Fe-4S binding protein [Promethearchaeota archaeon]